MKKIIILLVLILCGCQKGVTRKINTTVMYNEIEINAAMDEVEKNFQEYLPNCTLLELSFDENNYLNQQYQGTEIAIYGKVNINDTKVIDGLKSGSVEDRFFWTLVINSRGYWEITGQGL